MANARVSDRVRWKCVIHSEITPTRERHAENHGPSRAGEISNEETSGDSRRGDGTASSGSDQVAQFPHCGQRGRTGCQAARTSSMPRTGKHFQPKTCASPMCCAAISASASPPTSPRGGTPSSPSARATSWSIAGAVRRRWMSGSPRIALSVARRPISGGFARFAAHAAASERGLSSSESAHLRPAPGFTPGAADPSSRARTQSERCQRGRSPQPPRRLANSRCRKPRAGWPSAGSRRRR